MTTTTPKRRSPWLLANLAMLAHRGTQGAQRARPVAHVTRRGGGALLRRWPAALSTTRSGAGNVAKALQALPSSTAQSLTAGSLGFGAGVYLGRAPRIVKVLGIGPAIAMGVSMLRRHDRHVDAQAGGGAGLAHRGETELGRMDDDGSPSIVASSQAVPRQG